ncbi:MAG: helix-turn-helix domain-containing protein [Oceanospirillaceae bacterium]|nr:helix-turn-helix domain-containing protein [Oceanospirillaceae bacterium]
MILTIGQLAAQSGCKIATIRYYEEIQLMPLAQRSSGNQRQYHTPDLTRLKFIRHSRELGFSLDDIRELLGLSEATNINSHQAEVVALKQLEFTQSRIQRLQSLAAELTTMLHQCDHDQTRTCRVIEVLADHQLCQGH